MIIQGTASSDSLIVVGEQHDRRAISLLETAMSFQHGPSSLSRSSAWSWPIMSTTTTTVVKTTTSAASLSTKSITNLIYGGQVTSHPPAHNIDYAQELFRKCLLTTTNNDDSKSLNDTSSLQFSFECFHFKLTHDFKFFMLSMLFLFIISLDIFSNLIVLVSILIEKSKKRVDLCFASNAIADLLMGLVIMPFTAIFTLFGYFPFNPPIVCFLWNVMDFTAGTASMLHIAFISYDRYLSVSKPYKYTQKSNTQRFSVTGIPTVLILVFIWFFALAAWIPALLYFKSRNQHANTNIFETESKKFFFSYSFIQMVKLRVLLIYFTFIM